jgi:hypothetical protein
MKFAKIIYVGSVLFEFGLLGYGIYVTGSFDVGNIGFIEAIQRLALIAIGLGACCLAASWAKGRIK